MDVVNVFCFAFFFKSGCANDQIIYASYFYAMCDSFLIKIFVKESISIWLFVVINFSYLIIYYNYSNISPSKKFIVSCFLFVRCEMQRQLCQLLPSLAMIIYYNFINISLAKKFIASCFFVRWEMQQELCQLLSSCCQVKP